MQGLANGSGTSVQFCDHAFDFLTQAQCVDINTKDIGTCVQSL